jgi:hypothetical protein
MLGSDRGIRLSLVQVAYFVTTTMSTVGYGDIVPDPKRAGALFLAIVTQFCAVTMLTILVSKAFSLVSPRIGSPN